MAIRARVGRYTAGLVVAGALLAAVPGQALADTPAPTPQPSAPTATAAPQPAEKGADGRKTGAAAPQAAPDGAGSQVSRVPAGAPETGGGSTANGADPALLALGALGLVGAAGLGGTLVARRRRDVPLS